MKRELWATYSVKDHFDPRILATDVLLFDRLVFPVPQQPDRLETEGAYSPQTDMLWKIDAEEWARWEELGWRPEAQQRVLEILKPVLRRVPWRDDNIKSQYRLEAARLAAQGVGDWAFAATRSTIAQGLPAYVGGVEAMGPSFPTFEQFDKAADSQLGASARVQGKMLATVLATEFFVPDPESPGDPLELLKETVDFVVGDAEFRASRQAFNEWQNGFLKQGSTDAESIQRAVADMRGLLEDARMAAKRLTIRKVVRNVFRLAPSGLGIAASVIGANPMFAIGGAFLSVGAITVDEKLFKSAESGQPAPTVFVKSARRHFGWPEK